MSNDVTVIPSEAAWIVRAGGAILAETRRALELRESDHPPVVFIPLEDVAMALFDPSPTRSSCPRKGQARYFSFVGQDGAIPDAALSYEAPSQDVAALVGHIAFSSDRVTVQRA